MLNKQHEILILKLSQLERIISDSLTYNENELTKWIQCEEDKRGSAFKAIEQKMINFVSNEKSRLGFYRVYIRLLQMLM